MQYATQYKIKVVFSLLGTPPWANAAKGWNVAPTNVLDLKRFATRRPSATAATSSGRTAGARRRAQLARVERAEQPRLPEAAVQARAGRRWTLQSAKDYAKMCNAVVQRRSTTTLGAAKVACGVTGPRGNNNPNRRAPSLSPLAFLRAIKAAGASGFDAYAHHPYYGSPVETPSTPPPPGIHGNAPTAITLGNFPASSREVTRLYGNKRMWITEYGYQTNPPDRAFGVRRCQAGALPPTQAYD